MSGSMDYSERELSGIRASKASKISTDSGILNQMAQNKRERYSMNYQSYEAAAIDPEEQTSKMLSYMFPGYETRKKMGYYEKVVQTDISLHHHLQTIQEEEELKQKLSLQDYEEKVVKVMEEGEDKKMYAKERKRMGSLAQHGWVGPPLIVKIRCLDFLFLEVTPVALPPVLIRLNKGAINNHTLEFKYIPGPMFVPQVIITISGLQIYPLGKYELQNINKVLAKRPSLMFTFGRTVKVTGGGHWRNRADSIEGQRKFHIQDAFKFGMDEQEAPRRKVIQLPDSWVDLTVDDLLTHKENRLADLDFKEEGGTEKLENENPLNVILERERSDFGFLWRTHSPKQMKMEIPADPLLPSKHFVSLHQLPVDMYNTSADVDLLANVDDSYYSMIANLDHKLQMDKIDFSEKQTRVYKPFPLFLEDHTENETIFTSTYVDVEHISPSGSVANQYYKIPSRNEIDRILSSKYTSRDESQNQVDASVIDTNVIDTNVIDTNVIDTNVIDTNVIDTNVIDTTLPQGKKLLFLDKNEIKDVSKYLISPNDNSSYGTEPNEIHSDDELNEDSFSLPDLSVMKTRGKRGTLFLKANLNENLDDDDDDDDDDGGGGTSNEIDKLLKRFSNQNYRKMEDDYEGSSNSESENYENGDERNFNIRNKSLSDASAEINSVLHSKISKTLKSKDESNPKEPTRLVSFNTQNEYEPFQLGDNNANVYNKEKENEKHGSISKSSKKKSENKNDLKTDSETDREEKIFMVKSDFGVDKDLIFNAIQQKKDHLLKTIGYDSEKNIFDKLNISHPPFTGKNVEDKQISFPIDLPMPISESTALAQEKIQIYLHDPGIICKAKEIQKDNIQSSLNGIPTCNEIESNKQHKISVKKPINFHQAIRESSESAQLKNNSKRLSIQNEITSKQDLTSKQDVTSKKIADEHFQKISKQHSRGKPEQELEEIKLLKKDDNFGCSYIPNKAINQKEETETFQNQNLNVFIYEEIKQKTTNTKEVMTDDIPESSLDKHFRYSKNQDGFEQNKKSTGYVKEQTKIERSNDEEIGDNNYMNFVYGPFYPQSQSTQQKSEFLIKKCQNRNEQNFREDRFLTDSNVGTELSYKNRFCKTNTSKINEICFHSEQKYPEHENSENVIKELSPVNVFSHKNVIRPIESCDLEKDSVQMLNNRSELIKKLPISKTFSTQLPSAYTKNKRIGDFDPNINFLSDNTLTLKYSGDSDQEKIQGSKKHSPKWLEAVQSKSKRTSVAECLLEVHREFAPINEQLFVLKEEMNTLETKSHYGKEKCQLEVKNQITVTDFKNKEKSNKMSDRNHPNIISDGNFNSSNCNEKERNFTETNVIDLQQETNEISSLKKYSENELPIVKSEEQVIHDSTSSKNIIKNSDVTYSRAKFSLRGSISSKFKELKERKKNNFVRKEEENLSGNVTNFTESKHEIDLEKTKIQKNPESNLRGIYMSSTSCDNENSEKQQNSMASYLENSEFQNFKGKDEKPIKEVENRKSFLQVFKKRK